jgi:hypothetical protein
VKDFLPTADSSVVRGAHAGDGPGYTLEAIAVRVSVDITTARQHGDIPAHPRTVVTILPHQRTLEIRVEGFDTIPGQSHDRSGDDCALRMVSSHNIIALDAVTPPLFTQHILLVNSFGQPFAAMVGAGVGEPKPVMPQ